MHRRLSRIAKALGRDFRLKLEPGSWWAYHFDTNKITYPVRTMLGNSDAENIAVICHELAHRLYSRLPTDDLINNRAFHFLLNAVEDIRINRIICERYAGVPPLMDELYLDFTDLDRRRQEEAKPNAQGEKAPRSQQFGLGAIYEWAAKGQQDPLITDSKVIEALERARPFIEEATRLPPNLDLRFDELEGAEADAEAKRSFEIVRDAIWPIYQELLELDVQDAADDLQKALDDQALDQGAPSDSAKAEDPEETRAAQGDDAEPDGVGAESESTERLKAESPGDEQPSETTTENGNVENAESGVPDEASEPGSTEEAESSAAEEAENGEPGAAENGEPGAAENGEPGAAENGEPGAAENGESGAAENGEPGAAENGESGAAENGESGAAENGSGAAENGESGAAENGEPGAAENGEPGAAENGEPGGAENGEPGTAEGPPGDPSASDSPPSGPPSGFAEGPPRPMDSPVELDSIPDNPLSVEASADPHDPVSQAKKTLESLLSDLARDMGGQILDAEEGREDYDPSEVAPMDGQEDPSVPSPDRTWQTVGLGGGSPVLSYEGDETVELQELLARYDQKIKDRPSERDSLYQIIEKQHRGAIQELTDELSNFFQRDELPDLVGHFRGGVYDLRKAIQSDFRRRATGRGDPKIFLKRDAPQERNVQIVFCIDCSGSMGHAAHSKMSYAREAFVVFVEALGELQIDHGVIMYNAGVSVLKPLDVDADGPQREQMLRKLRAGGENNDSAALAAAREMLEDGDATQKLVFFLSDGAAVQNHKDVVNAVGADTDIKVIGIGIGDGCQAVPDTYQHSLVVEQTSQLPRRLGELLMTEIMDA